MPLILARIDLSFADVALFEAYENQVLAQLAQHGARLIERLRSEDGTAEFHLLDFPDADALDAYRSDSVRLAAQPIWEACGATSSVKVVRRMDHAPSAAHPAGK